VAAWLNRVFFARRSSADLQFDALDGLRGIAVVFVVLSHAARRGLHALPGLSLAGSGKYGVYLFFVLSAFLLTLAMLSRSDAELRQPGYWLGYAIRRVLRIFPLYVIVLATSHVFSTHLGSSHFVELSAAELSRHLSLAAGKAIFWSIPVELKYYVALPVVVLMMVLVLRRRPWPVLGVGLLAIAAARFWLWPGSAFAANSIHLEPYLAIFLCGSLSAYLHWILTTKGGVRSRSARVLFEAAALAALALVACMIPEAWRRLGGNPGTVGHLRHDYLLFGCLWSVFVLGMMNGIGLLRWLLATRPLRLIGIVSFSAYLWHLPVIAALTDQLPSRSAVAGAREVVVFLIVVLVACLSYVVIERPTLHLGSKRLRAREAELKTRASPR